jgi:Na+/phosphate symporter
VTAAEKREVARMVEFINDLTARLDRIIEKLDERDREQREEADDA